MDKARSLTLAEENLDDDGLLDREPRLAEPASNPGTNPAVDSAVDSERGPAEEGFAPASASQSGFSPARSEPAGEAEVELSGFPGLSAGGGRSSGGRLAGSLQTALSAASRNEAGLGSLQRAIRDASRAFTASRQAQEALTEELRVMHRGLTELMSEKAALERYAALLTQERDAALDAAEEARREAKREREFLLREQDRFIQLLLEEHEAELAQVRRNSRPPAAAAPGAPGDRAEAASLGAARQSAPPDDGRLSGAALARQALATVSDSQPPERAPSEPPGPDASRAPVAREVERTPTYPPPPAVLDLDVLAAEVDGNSERPPPIRRIGVADASIHLKPARVPTQLFDTLMSPPGESGPERKG